MTIHEIARLGCKLLSIYAIINALNSLPRFGSGLAYYLQRQPGEEIRGISYAIILIGGIIPFILFIMFGLLLWFMADTLSVRMAKDMEASPLGTKVVVDDVASLAFFVVGLIILAHMIPDVAQLSIILLYKAQMYAEIPSQLRGQRLLTAETMGLIGSLIIQLALGLWLIFGSGTLIRFFKNIRNTGITNSDK